MDKDFKKNFLKGSAAATIGTVVSMVFHFLSIMIITRSIETVEFGIYALVLVVVHLFNILSGLGLELTLVKHISGGTDTEKREILFPVLVLRTAQVFFIAVIFYLAGTLILPLFGDGLEKYTLMILILFIITNYRDLFYYLLQGLNYFRRFAYVQISSAFIRVALIAALVFFGTIDLLSLLYIEIITTFLALVIQLFLIPLKRMIHVHFKKEVFTGIFRFSFPLYLNNMLAFTSGRIQVLIIAVYLTPVSVALYDISSKVPDALKRMFHSFIIVFFPGISSLFAKGDIANGEKLMLRSLSAFAIIIMFGVLISFIFSQEITLLLFSEKYIESSAAFALLMFSFYLVVISNIMGYSLVSLGFSSVPVKVNSVSNFVSIAGSILLIPFYGFIGVVYAQLGMHIVSQIFYRYYLIKAGIKTGTAEYLKPVVLAAGIYIVYLIQPVHTTTVKIIFILLYPLIGWFWLSEIKKLLGFFSNSLKLRQKLAANKGVK